MAQQRDEDAGKPHDPALDELIDEWMSTWDEAEAAEDEAWLDAHHPGEGEPGDALFEDDDLDEEDDGSDDDLEDDEDDEGDDEP